MIRYRGYTICPSGFNYTIKKPNGEGLEAGLAASVERAKKWIDWDIFETNEANARKARNKAVPSS